MQSLFSIYQLKKLILKLVMPIMHLSHHDDRGALEKIMSITAFGKAIRDARRATGETLLSMAEAMQCSVAFLSAIETGKSKIPAERVREIEQFFATRG